MLARCEPYLECAEVLIDVLPAGNQHKPSLIKRPKTPYQTISSEDMMGRCHAVSCVGVRQKRKREGLRSQKNKICDPG